MTAASIRTSVRVPGGATSAKDNVSPDAPMHAVLLEKRFETSIGRTLRLSSVVALAIALPRTVAASPVGILTVAMLSSVRNGAVVVLIEVRAWHKGTVTAKNLEPARKPARARQNWESA